MKNVLFTFICIFSLVATATASDQYAVDEAKMDALFAEAAAYDFETNVPDALRHHTMLPFANGEQTKGGYLLRAFFCGGFALHRYYMGTGGESLWWKYLCIPGVGGFVACVDFWRVVLDGSRMEEYRDNPKWIVWAGN